MHDHQTGMPRGQTGPMLCMTAEGQTEQTDGKTDIGNNAGANSENTSVGHSKDVPGGDVNAATKGNGKDKKGAKGYGECWHCGQQGHPRRECPEWLKLQGGSVAV